jgi:hypothetical protein
LTANAAREDAGGVRIFRNAAFRRLKVEGKHFHSFPLALA